MSEKELIHEAHEMIGQLSELVTELKEHTQKLQLEISTLTIMLQEERNRRRE